MFLVELKCNKCDRKLNKDEEVTIKTKVSELKGITNLKSWATMQDVYCKSCSQE